MKEQKRKSWVLLFAMLFMCVNFVGCENNFDPSVSSSRTQVKINAFPLVQRQKDFEGNQLFYEGEIDHPDVRLRLQALFYDSNGTLVKTATVQEGNVKKEVSLTVADLSQDQLYKVLVVADFVMVEGNKIELEFWGLRDEYNYSTAKLVDQGYVGNRYRSVGVGYATVYGGEQAHINIEGLGCFVYMYFYNVGSYVDNIEYNWSDVKEYLLATKTPTSTTVYYDDYEVDHNYTGFYDARYIIPVNRKCVFGWAIDGYSVTRGEKSVEITPASTYRWSVNSSNNLFENVYFNY